MNQKNMLSRKQIRKQKRNNKKVKKDENYKNRFKYILTNYLGKTNLNTTLLKSS
jgi:tryptophan synthase beta subunit